MPTKRQLRVLRNLALKNYVWEQTKSPQLVQFDESSGKEVLLGRAEIDSMAAAGWLQRIHHPPSAQRLDHFEITDFGLALLEQTSRKAPAREPLPDQAKDQLAS